jgi:hypothetical protein
MQSEDEKPIIKKIKVTSGNKINRDITTNSLPKKRKYIKRASAKLAEPQILNDSVMNILRELYKSNVPPPPIFVIINIPGGKSS